MYNLCLDYFQKGEGKEERNLNLLRIYCVTGYIVCIYFLLCFMTIWWDKACWQVKTMRLRRFKANTLAMQRSDSPFGFFPNPNLLFFPPFHAAPRRTWESGQYKAKENRMVKSENSSHIQDRMVGRQERMDKQCRIMEWLLQGIQLFKDKLFKN